MNKEQQEDSFLEYTRASEDFISLLEVSNLGHRAIGDKCFSLTTGKVVFAIQLAETSDSFILGLPALLVNSEDGVKGRSFVNQPCIRLFKSNILFVMNPELMHKQYYYRYVWDNRESLTWYLNELREKEIQTVIHSQILSEEYQGLSPSTTPIGSSPQSFTITNNSKERH